jgi:hypothetical protein
MANASFVFGFAFAFYWGWLLTVILLASIPFMIICGIGMAYSMKGAEDSLKAYA